MEYVTGDATQQTDLCFPCVALLAHPLHLPPPQALYSGMLLPVALMLLCACAAGAPPDEDPQQVHLALGHTPDHVTVQWSTLVPPRPTPSAIQYGPSPDGMGAEVLARHFILHDQGPKRRNITMHLGVIKGLSASTRYYYRVGGNGRFSDTFSFVTMPDAATLEAGLPMTFAVYGDQGHANGQSLQRLIKEVRDGNLSMVFHVGDFAYNFESGDGANGDAYMRDIEPIAATVPYMVVPGNHESSVRFNAYTHRFANQPSNSGTVTMPEFGPMPNNWWFSWNAGLVHFVSISTEVYMDQYYIDLGLVARQWEWLRQDLMRANANRSEAPWIVVGGHRPLYCSCDGDCDGASETLRDGVWDGQGRQVNGLERLFYAYGVDVYVAGHEHNYERMYDVAPARNATVPWLSGATTQSTVNPPATVHVVTGSAGNIERHEAFKRAAPPRTAFRSNTYGYSRMRVYNRTHVRWEQVMTDNGQPPEEDGRVIDSVWWVQEHHGPFEGRRPGPRPSPPKRATTVDVVRDGSSALRYPCGTRVSFPRCAGASEEEQREMEALGMWSYSKLRGLR